MEKIRKSILIVIISSLMGGTFGAGSYYFFASDDVGQSNEAYNKEIKFTNYIVDTTDVLVPKSLNFINTSKNVTPTVVHIRTTYQGKNYVGRSPFEDMFRDFFGERYNQREREVPQRRGSGSGVIMTKDGYIITNNHVVENATEVEVLLNDNRTFIASVEGTDPTTDLSLIHISEPT